MRGSTDCRNRDLPIVLLLPLDDQASKIDGVVVSIDRADELACDLDRRLVPAGAGSGAVDIASINA
jgi:hypothetical protein